MRALLPFFLLTLRAFSQVQTPPSPTSSPPQAFWTCPANATGLIGFVNGQFVCITLGPGVTLSSTGVLSATPVAPSMPFDATASGATLTIGSTCSTSAPCNAALNTTVFSWLAPIVITLAAGSAGTEYAYIDPTGAFSITGTAGATCGSPCFAVPGTTPPPMSILLWNFQAVAGAWLPASATDQRAYLRQTIVACAGVVCANSGTVQVVQ